MPRAFEGTIGESRFSWQWITAMILQCPSCSSKFKVPDGMIPPEGRVVKCSRCAHQWHATLSSEQAPPMPAPSATQQKPAEPVDQGPEDIVEHAARAMQVAEQIVSAAPDAAAAPAAPAAAKKPAPPLKIPVKPFMIAAPTMAALWLIFAVMAHYPSWIEAPVFGGIYRTLGVHTTEGILFEDLSLQQQKEEGKTKYILSGSIANHASVDRVVPSVRVMLSDAEGDKIWEHEYVVNEPLKGGEVYPFRIDNVETSFGDKVSTVVIDVGHKLQLMMR